MLSHVAETQTYNRTWKSCAKILGHIEGQAGRVVPMSKQAGQLELESYHRMETLTRRIWGPEQKHISQLITGPTLW